MLAYTSGISYYLVLLRSYTVYNLISIVLYRIENMAEQEGVIKYQLNHQQQALPENCLITELNSWRSVLYRLGLIGQDDKRYDGYGFGNISQRHQAHSQSFIISGSQTGHLEQLSQQQYSLVNSADIKRNIINSSGNSKPSSEALTHACVYQHNSQAHAVIHSHCPEIWQHTHTLKLLYTTADIAYGTIEMAQAVADLLNLNPSNTTGIFSMLGHKDGIIAYGKSIEEAAWLMIKYLNLAIQIEQS